MKIDRRRFIELAGLAGLVLMAPTSALAGSPKRGRIVVFVELNGGNDGLNTVIPYTDPAYRKLRPSLSLPSSKVLGLDADTGLHPSLARTAKSWEAGELAIVEGLGYPDPNRSHFRSIEIWESGSDSAQYVNDGWVSRVAPDLELAKYAPAAMTFGGGGDGPLSGARSLELEEPQRLFNMTKRLRRHSANTTNPALRHVLQTQNELLDDVDVLRRHIDKAPSLKQHFGGVRQLRPLELAAEVIGSGLPLLAVKIRVPGFDTHVNQARQHERLLATLDAGLGGFRDAMKAVGMWDDVLVVTYSEFGRRPRENGGGGTDHGTAAPQLVMGGAVKGGRYGARPSLDDLDSNGDLKFTTDFRRVYSTIAANWWGFGAGEFSGFRGLGFV